MTGYEPGDTWEAHYRGYELRINAEREIWWQVYDGTDRLYLEPEPADLIEAFLDLKPLGGRVRVTEAGTVITRRETEGIDGPRGSSATDDYTPVYVGELQLDGELVPRDAPEFGVPLRPASLDAGDLWPSVYDGARYSFGADGRAWWHDPASKKRYPVDGGLPRSVDDVLRRLKPQGGSFRLTPWGDVVTLVGSTDGRKVQEQFGDLPRVVRNIVKLRRDRADLQMLPVYAGEISDRPLEVREPPSLTDSLSRDERDALEGWAASLGATSPTRENDHGADRDDSIAEPETPASSEDDESAGSDGSTGTVGRKAETDDPPEDDPVAWLVEDMEKMVNESDEPTI